MSDPQSAPPRERSPRGDGLTRLQRATYRVWLAVGVLVLIAVAGLLLYRPLAVILAPLLVALLLVYLLDPIVSWLQQRRVPRFFGTLLAYLLVAGVVTGGVLALTPAVSAQLTEFAEAAPELGEELVEQTEAAAGAVGVDLDPEDLQIPALTEQAQDFAAEAENREVLVALLGGLAGLARGALFVILAVLLGPVIAFYILVDLPNLRRRTRALIPPRHRAEVLEVSGKLGGVVGGFVRGQLLVSLMIGLATSIALAVIGLPFWLLVGVIAAITNIVPLVGPFVAGLLGSLIGFVTEGLGFAVLVALIMTAVQQLDGQLMSPLIFGKTVRIHPIGVLLGITVAAALFGIIGMLLVVPLVAGAKVLLLHLWQTRVPWAEELDETDAARAPDDGAAAAAAEQAPAPAEQAPAGGTPPPPDGRLTEERRPGEQPGRDQPGGDQLPEDQPSEDQPSREPPAADPAAAPVSRPGRARSR